MWLSSFELFVFALSSLGFDNFNVELVFFVKSGISSTLAVIVLLFVGSREEWLKSSIELNYN
jgi:hypothetical protein